MEPVPNALLSMPLIAPTFKSVKASKKAAPAPAPSE
jgi:hypothetical protein